MRSVACWLLHGLRLSHSKLGAGSTRNPFGLDRLIEVVTTGRVMAKGGYA